jgi:hypothetical protein
MPDVTTTSPNDAAKRRVFNTLKKGDGTIAGLMRAILDPLCEQTAKLLKPVRLSSNDRLKVELSDDEKNFIVQPYAMLNGQYVTASYDARGEGSEGWIGRVPERESMSAKHSGTVRYEMAATDITALIINAVWPDEQLDMEPRARTVYTFLLTRFLSQTLQSQHRANFKIRGVLPEAPKDWVDSDVKPLADYQRVACHCSLGQDGSALFAEQGTGKTPIAWRRICMESERLYPQAAADAIATGKKRQLYRVLVICPKNVRENWAREGNEFATNPGKVTVIRGGQVERLKLILETISDDGDDSRFGVCVMSYEGVRRSWDIVRSIHWHLVVADESHYIKDFRTERWKTLVQLRNISDARMILTGTPVTNTILDLYAQLEFLGEGLSGFNRWNAFKKFYCTTEQKGMYEKITGFQNLPFLQERLARVAFMITKKEALPGLPEKLNDVIYVEMTKKQREWYIAMQEKLALEIEDGSEDGKRMTAQMILVKMLRLAQITSGFATWDAKFDPETGDAVEARKIEFVEPNPKLEALVEFIKTRTADDEKVIVWACFKPDIRAIKERLDKEGITCGVYNGDTKDKDRAALEESFNRTNAKDMKVFIGNAAAGGTGLNLRGYEPDDEGTERDHGCNCAWVVYYSQNWSMVHRGQSEDRAHRRGTRVPVTYVDIVVPQTIDVEIRARVVLKKVRADNIQDVRELLARVLTTIPEEDDE